MAKGYKTLSELNWAGRRVLVRVDFNVPLGPNGSIRDETRIIAALPTIRYLLDAGASVALFSHLGRPKGECVSKYTLFPLKASLEKQLNQAVFWSDDCIGSDRLKQSMALKPGELLLCENLRFHSGETDNDAEFSAALAEGFDAYVNDAFGAAHRAHASTTGVTKHISHCAAGLLMARELEVFDTHFTKPKRPFLVLLGGAKVSDKLSVIDALLDKADKMLIGGAMAYTFRLAQGVSVGDSLVEPDKVDLVKGLLAKAEAKGVDLLLPQDHVITDTVDFNQLKLGALDIVESDFPAGWQGVDIGPKTIDTYKAALAGAKSIFWNGPMGIFEIDAAAKGSMAMAEAVGTSSAFTIVGGGDSVRAIHRSAYSDKIDFISTGGGASLTLVEGKTLPALECLLT